MAAFISLITVVALMAIAAVGAGMMNLRDVFGVFIPYVAFAVFVVGFLAKVVGWAKTPVPFRIPTTGGQQKSLSWIKDSPLDNPSSTLGTVARMGLEIFLFRSLFRNTKIDLRQDGMKLAYGSAKALWLFALLFHYSFFLVAMRHLRFFT